MGCSNTGRTSCDNMARLVILGSCWIAYPYGTRDKRHFLPNSLVMSMRLKMVRERRHTLNSDTRWLASLTPATYKYPSSAGLAFVPARDPATGFLIAVELPTIGFLGPAIGLRNGFDIYPMVYSCTDDIDRWKVKSIELSTWWVINRHNDQLYIYHGWTTKTPSTGFPACLGTT